MASCYNFYEPFFRPDNEYSSRFLITTLATKHTEYKPIRIGKTKISTRCDAREFMSYPVETQVAIVYTHPPMNLTLVPSHLSEFSDHQRCTMLGYTACSQGSAAFASATASYVTSRFKSYFPYFTSIDTYEMPKSIVWPAQGGTDGKGGLPAQIFFDGNLPFNAIWPSGGNGVCNDYTMPDWGDCPSEITGCEIEVVKATVYYWPTTSAGDFCGSKTRLPNSQTIPGAENTVVIQARVGESSITTEITSPSALLVFPMVKRHFFATQFIESLYQTVSWRKSCGNNFQTTFAMQMHPDDISSKTYVKTASTRFTTTASDGHKSVHTKIDLGWQTSRIDFGAAYNAHWAPGLADESNTFVMGRWGLATLTLRPATTLSNGYVYTPPPDSMKRMNPDWVPRLALPIFQMYQKLGDWMNHRDQTAFMIDPPPSPFCRMGVDPEVAYIPITQPTIIASKPHPDATTITIATPGPDSNPGLRGIDAAHIIKETTQKPVDAGEWRIL
jgi:hypothetical protein